MSRFDDVFDNVPAPRAVKSNQGKALRCDRVKVIRLDDFRRRSRSTAGATRDEQSPIDLNSTERKSGSPLVK